MQSASPPRSGLDQPPDTQGWAPVALEHYNTSIVPWIGRKGTRWLEAQTRPSRDPGLVLISPELYNLWKAHATGSGAPFPRELLKRRAASDQADAAAADQGEQMTSAGRALMVLGTLLVVAFIFILFVLLTHKG